ncbi:membrane bound O-acyl transferase MBOAT family protein [Cellulophaga geojensis KL-A]|uniref:Membrane bound O-acyl transferase MBOAT family protein n=1 Tax=Cellulophaga geojensis KL-A TaxID=1328323 RepID=A0ABN0RQ92_9FLAO|nr:MULTISPECIES: MBOAT family O-acyltransferase [Cellulophaga]APU11315.1 acyltransferase [Cellulophaga lytica]EWH14055.1 membrane bound O-acyl transferase MBOAT family protein [Cellulophaga geojensis KL-A]
MLFNSIDFAIFLPIVFFLYWVVVNKNLQLQNFLLLVASYVFYGWWDWRFLSLIAFSTLVDYSLGVLLGKEEKESKRKVYLWTSIIVNLGFLGFFKYYNFFVESFVDAFTFFGQEIEIGTLNIILPVGISFYTFQTLSYTIDVYKRNLEPTKKFIAFAAFVSFFPQLVAGPIERASNLLPQILKKRSFNYCEAKDGLRLMLWGLFKKVVIADSLSPIVNDIFSNYSTLSSPVLIMGAIFFAFQIYGDFSGYSDIAIGTAKLFGIELMSNFKFPYFSKNIGEFWRRWHISLSTWFRDYLYIPLGGSRGSKMVGIRNVFAIFLVSGFWHGANWTFIFWGLFHALLFLPSFLIGTNRKYAEVKNTRLNVLAMISNVYRTLLTFILVTIGWVFFRSETITDSFIYLKRIGSSFSGIPYIHPNGYRLVDYIVLLVFFIVYEYIIRNNERKPIGFKNRYVRLFVYVLLVFLMLLFYDDGVDRSFIYFQF